jgi:hypothetical protein
VLRIPAWPEVLALPIERRFDGSPCDDHRLHGRVELSAAADGLRLCAGLPHQRVPVVPAAAPGTRVEQLWHSDVVECFLAGAGGDYLEVELGAAGHYLVLRFDAPRRLLDDCRSFRPALEFDAGASAWRSRLCVPWELVPDELCAVNAFVAVGDHFLAYHPVPGDVPDFHQPDRYPRAALERGARGSYGR